MATRESYEPGIPSWVDVMSPDVEASRRFYAGLFGWDTEDQLDDDGNLIYVMFRKDGRDVAGLGGQPPGMEGMPAVWNHYVATADAEAATAATVAAGGSVVMPAMDVLDAGRMAVLQDPGGAGFSVWEAGEHIGAGLVNGPGAFGWSELLTRHLDEVRPFYEQVFGWRLVDQDMPNGVYTVATFDGRRTFAGMMAMPADTPDEVPDHWAVYFGHDDVDAACDRVVELGGRVVMPPFDIPGVGRVAVVQDPQGATFDLMAAATWED